MKMIPISPDGTSLIDASRFCNIQAVTQMRVVAEYAGSTGYRTHGSDVSGVADALRNRNSNAGGDCPRRAYASG